MFCFVGFLSVFFSLSWLVARLCVRACVNTLEMQNLCKDVIYLNFKRKMIFVFFYRWIFWFLNYISRLFVRTLFLSLELIKYWQNCVVTNLRLIQSNFLPTFLFNSSMHDVGETGNFLKFPSIYSETVYSYCKINNEKSTFPRKFLLFVI